MEMRGQKDLKERLLGFWLRVRLGVETNKVSWGERAGITFGSVLFIFYFLFVSQENLRRQQYAREKEGFAGERYLESRKHYIVSVSGPRKQKSRIN